MGKKKDKKGKGAEKTAAKTEKKLSNKMKKELQALGEDDIEKIVAEIEKEEKKRLQVTEINVEAPSRRLNFTFIPHPEKEQLILYGGEFFDGRKTFLYNDLYFYNIPNNTWTVVKCPGAPPPRCGHQMVATSVNKGQLWIFGGEFASPSQSQFYHYKDLWVYHLQNKQWEKITAPDGPSARSGHRMVYIKKQLFVFGGFHDNLRSYKYFNDIYSFNTETYKWVKLNPAGTPPAPRSGCCMVAFSDGKILIFGGYSKQSEKKDVDVGKIHSDAFLLVPDKNDATNTKCKWMQIKLDGIRFSPRCSMPIAVASNNLSAYCFGGVFDIEDDEEINGKFYNDMFCLDLMNPPKFVWKNVNIYERKEKEQKPRRNKNKADENQEEEEDEEMEVENIQEVQPTTISDDGVFKVTIGPAPATSSAAISEVDGKKIFQPSPRINCGLAIKHGILYLYGGMCELGSAQVTYSDFYSLDLKKLDGWKTIINDNTATAEWLGSESESGESDDNEESGSEESSEDSAMEEN